MNENKDELMEEVTQDLGSVRQDAGNYFMDPGVGTAPEKPKKPIAVAITEPTEETEETEAAEVTDAPAATDAPENTVETVLHIVCDYDGNSETPLEDAPESIALENVEGGFEYQLESAGKGNDQVHWKSSDEKIATVSETGLVTFTGEEGEVTIELWSTGGEAYADTVTFSTAAEAVPTETAPVEKEGGLSIGSLLPYAVIALLCVVIVVMMLQRKAEEKKRKQRKQKRAEQKKAEQKAAAAEMEQTVAQPVPVPTAAPAPEASTETVMTPVQPMTGIRAGVYQAIGARKDQQDSYGMTDPDAYAANGVMALVADGMGGLANGKAVSSALVNTFLSEYRAMMNRETPQDTLVKMAISANQRINQMLVGADRSGSTLVSVVIREGLLHFMTVGDSRIYLYRGGALLQLNREHIYQEELAVKAVNCQVPLSQVTGDRQAHALTSFFGSGSITHMDRNYEGIRLVPGDRVLLCSDGVFGTLSQAQMEQAMKSDVKTAAETLKDMVLAAGKQHQDNNTCLILEYLG